MVLPYCAQNLGLGPIKVGNGFSTFKTARQHVGTVSGPSVRLVGSVECWVGQLHGGHGLSPQPPAFGWHAQCVCHLARCDLSLWHNHLRHLTPLPQGGGLPHVLQSRKARVSLCPSLRPLGQAPLPQQWSKLLPCHGRAFAYCARHAVGGTKGLGHLDEFLQVAQLDSTGVRGAVGRNCAFHGSDPVQVGLSDALQVGHPQLVIQRWGRGGRFAAWWRVAHERVLLYAQGGDQMRSALVLPQQVPQVIQRLEYGAGGGVHELAFRGVPGLTARRHWRRLARLRLDDGSLNHVLQQLRKVREQMAEAVHSIAGMPRADGIVLLHKGTMRIRVSTVE
mmetsp:Transcript_133872/g.232293  ORF Transcript_133872/g.232293 Transcript_133872/m.232293 type:complete len:335 (+) Transcript_133872:282-1286(+)